MEQILQYMIAVGQALHRGMKHVSSLISLTSCYFLQATASFWNYPKSLLPSANMSMNHITSVFYWQFPK